MKTVYRVFDESPTQVVNEQVVDVYTIPEEMKGQEYTLPKFKTALGKETLSADMPLLISVEIVHDYPVTVEPWEEAIRGASALVNDVWTFPYTVQDRDVDKLRNNRINDLRKRRWKAEIGNMVLSNSMRIKTDRESQSALGNLQRRMTLNPSLVVEWPLVDGGFASIGKINVDTMDDEMSDHVQAARTNERVLYDLLVAALTAQTVYEVDTDVGWPVNN
jgi:hypothetical protein